MLLLLMHTSETPADDAGHACTAGTHHQRDGKEEPSAPNLVRGEPVHGSLHRPRRHDNGQVPYSLQKYARRRRKNGGGGYVVKIRSIFVDKFHILRQV